MQCRSLNFVCLQLDISGMYIDHVFPVEETEMTSPATVDDQDLLISASSYQLQTLEAFVRNWAF